jgi:hypothetical protein
MTNIFRAAAVVAQAVAVASIAIQMQVPPSGSAGPITGGVTGTDGRNYADFKVAVLTSADGGATWWDKTHGEANAPHTALHTFLSSPPLSSPLLPSAHMYTHAHEHIMQHIFYCRPILLGLGTRPREQPRPRCETECRRGIAP